MPPSASRQQTNRAAVLYGAGDLRVENRELPVPGPSEVLVEVRAVGVCGSDVHYYQHGRIGSFVVEAPMVLGHEASGIVVDRNSSARRHAVGQRVAIEPGVPCGRCHICRSGRYNLCPDVKFLATPPIDGAFTRYVAVHEDFVFPVPDVLSYEAAALIEPLSVAVWACRRAGVSAGDRVIVTGAGPIGILCAQTAVAAGSTDVTICDVNPDRLARAASLSAATTIDSRTTRLADSGLRADILMECTGAESAIYDGLRTVRPAGTAMLIGMGAGEDARLPAALMQARELTVAGLFRYANAYPVAIELATSGRVQLDDLVDSRFGLEQAEQALRASTDDPSILKAVVLPHEQRTG